MSPYSKLPCPPQSFNDSQLVKTHGSEQHLGAVRVAYLPCEQAPELRIVEEMGPNFDPKEVLGVREGSKERSQDDAEDEKFGDWSIGEARSDHLVVSSGRTQAHLGTLSSGQGFACQVAVVVVWCLPHQVKSCLSGKWMLPGTRYECLASYPS